MVGCDRGILQDSINEIYQLIVLYLHIPLAVVTMQTRECYTATTTRTTQLATLKTRPVTHTDSNTTVLNLLRSPELLIEIKTSNYSLHPLPSAIVESTYHREHLCHYVTNKTFSFPHIQHRGGP